MATEVIIRLIIEAAAVIIPSSITILTLLTKKFYKHTIDNISFKIEEMAISNEQNLKKIYSKLDMHNQAITSYLQVKQAGQKIREITKHALEVTTDPIIRKILTKFTEEMVSYVRQVIDIGVQNIGEEQLLAKLDVAIDNINSYSKLLIGQEKIQYWHKLSSTYMSKYKKDILQVCSDKVNNKNDRFLIKSLDIVHTIVKQFVLYYLGLEQLQKKET